MPSTEICFHWCPQCKRDWHHHIKAGSSTVDEYFQPCLACRQDVVAQIIREDQRRVNASRPSSDELGRSEPAEVGEESGREECLAPGQGTSGEEWLSLEEELGRQEGVPPVLAHLPAQE